MLTFFLERDSSLFTNNAAEREIRNVKIKSKVQGAFRSDLGSEIYFRVRGYIATMKKNGQNQYLNFLKILPIMPNMEQILKD